MPKTSKKTQSLSTPIVLIRKKEWNDWVKRQSQDIQKWTKTSGFAAEPGKFCRTPDKLLVGVADTMDIWSIAGLPAALPPGGQYHLEGVTDRKTADMLMLGWLLGSYRFTRYKKDANPPSLLRPPPKCDMATVQRMSDAINQARDLINTPANDLGPAELATACKQVARNYNAEYSEIIGEDLLKQNYPAIYEVGKASSRAPRLIDIRWGDKRHPKVTLVGKGVCFDSGGLDIKPSAGMKLMKKDMGGGACMLAVARLIMGANLPVRLRLLVPAVENSISGNAYRPFDIINTRKGITVEVGNTDAEGRLILGDALFEADREKPELLIDCATLTGAARTALGTDIPALFTPDDTLAGELSEQARRQCDPLWRLPLWSGYREMLKSANADINSAPDSGFGGAITAALYLKEFVSETQSWAHIDMMAWNLTKRPGRPIGGEAMAVRALFAYISERFGE